MFCNSHPHPRREWLCTWTIIIIQYMSGSCNRIGNFIVKRILNWTSQCAWLSPNLSSAPDNEQENHSIRFSFTGKGSPLSSCVLVEFMDFPFIQRRPCPGECKYGFPFIAARIRRIVLVAPFWLFYFFFFWHMNSGSLYPKYSCTMEHEICIVEFSRLVLNF